MANTGNLRQASDVTERVELMLRNGETEKALDTLGLNYGPQARQMMEKVVKYSNLSTDELARVFGKISDILENVADKMEKYERLNEAKAKKQSALEAEEDAAAYAAIQQEALERKMKFEERMRWLDEQKRKMEEERRQLIAQKKMAKDAAKRREIEKKLKQLEKRKKYLEEERRNLEKLREENMQNGGRTGQTAGKGQQQPAETYTNMQRQTETQQQENNEKVIQMSVLRNSKQRA